MQRYSFNVGYLLGYLLQQESRSRTGAPLNPTTFNPKQLLMLPLVVCWINSILPSFKTLERDQDCWGGFCDTASLDLLLIFSLTNKRPITSAFDWLWWPAKFLYRGAFKAKIYLCLSQSKILALIVIVQFGMIL